MEFCRADITQPNEQGLTPVHIAAMIGDEKLLEVLICVFGMGVNSCDIVKKWTPLHFAARYNRPKLIELVYNIQLCFLVIVSFLLQTHSIIRISILMYMYMYINNE